MVIQHVETNGRTETCVERKLSMIFDHYEYHSKCDIFTKELSSLFEQLGSSP